VARDAPLLLRQVALLAALGLCVSAFFTEFMTLFLTIRDVFSAFLFYFVDFPLCLLNSSLSSLSPLGGE
jgi:hypothetical protein